MCFICCGFIYDLLNSLGLYVLATCPSPRHDKLFNVHTYCWVGMPRLIVWISQWPTFGKIRIFLENILIHMSIFRTFFRQLRQLSKFFGNTPPPPFMLRVQALLDMFRPRLTCSGFCLTCSDHVWHVQYSVRHVQTTFDMFRILFDMFRPHLTCSVLCSTCSDHVCVRHV